MLVPDLQKTKVSCLKSHPPIILDWLISNSVQKTYLSDDEVSHLSVMEVKGAALDYGQVEEEDLWLALIGGR